MIRINNRTILILIITLIFLYIPGFAQKTRDRVNQNVCSELPGLNGVYRIDIDGSDKLYSIIEGASSNVPFADQQQFFIDLAVRLTPPDLLAIQCNDRHISLASSRSPRIEFVADGATRNARDANGKTIRSRIALENNSLTFNSTGGSDNLNFTFTPIGNGERLRVTRRIAAPELIEPVVIQTVYYKISPVAQWDIFENPQVAGRQTSGPDEKTQAPASRPRPRTATSENSDADILRNALSEWIEATNRRDIEKQMSFYMPQLQAFYLSRNASRNAVRIEKTRAFAAAKSIDISAEEPEIIFQDAGRMVIMRFRKKYNIRNASKTRSGEVVQELRWQKTNDGWKIFSERDIRVLK